MKFYHALMLSLLCALMAKQTDGWYELLYLSGQIGFAVCAVLLIIATWADQH